MEIIRKAARQAEAPPPTRSKQRTAAPSSYAANQRAKRRGKQILDAIRKLDTGLDEGAQRDLFEFLDAHYAQAGGGVPIGLFGTCYLGEPYLDHIVNFEGSIVEHFKANRPVPEVYVTARLLARNSAYAFVEVYSDGSAVPVRPDGTPVV